MDIEADGLLMDATKVWCIVTMDLETEQIRTFTDPHAAIKHLNTADKIIAHNGTLYDLPLLHRLFDFQFPMNKVVDTILISRLLRPDRDGGHSLAAWGERLGFPKGDHTDFSQYSQEMLEYCINDVRVTAKLYRYLQAEADEYGMQVKQAVDLEHKFAHIIARQILWGFKLNVEKATNLYNELKEEYDSLHYEMSKHLPPVKNMNHFKTLKPEQILEQNDKEYTYIQGKTKKIVTKAFKFTDPNPTSRQQIISFFKEKYKWRPTEVTDKGNAKISEAILNTMKYSEAKILSRLFRIQKQMGMLKSAGGKGWLNCVNEQTGRVHGSVLTNATNTGRCSHRDPNMAQVDKKDLRMRDVWEAEDGYSLVGVDASGLELRLLGHYLAPYDKGAFAHQAVDGDIHTSNQQAMGLDKRDSAKTAIYALVYGAGNAKLGTVYTSDKGDHTTNENHLRQAGNQLRRNIEDNLTGYKNLADDVGKAFNTRGHLRGLDGRPLHPRTDYSALNLLIQSAGAIMMKQALVLFWERAIETYEPGVDFRLVANVHDEVQMEVKKGLEEELKNLMVKAMQDTRSALELKVAMDGEGMIGQTWKETH